MLNTYLTFDGNTREAFDFYQSVFGGELSIVQTYADGPDDMPVADEHKDKIMHVSYPIGSSVLMASDHVPGFGPPVTIGNNFTISVSPNSREQADNYFAKLSDGGEIKMAMEDTFWGSYFGLVCDRFGINWMINFDTQHG